jgi:hypothetical protein
MYLKQTMFIGYIVFTICATCNVIIIIIIIIGTPKSYVGGRRFRSNEEVVLYIRKWLQMP